MPARQPRQVIVDKPRPSTHAGKKPGNVITAERLVVAALDQDRPRFLRKDARGFHVVTLDPEKALAFESLGAAVLALDDFNKKKSGASWDGDFRPYRMKTRTTFEPA